MKRVAIIGAVSDYWGRVDWDDDDLEIWTVPRIADQLPRVDRVYELHAPAIAEHYAAAVKASGAECLTWDDLPEFDGPISNTVSAMLAHALQLGIEYIEIHGAPHNGESRAAREGVMYWIGRLHGAGSAVADFCDMYNWGQRYGKA